MIDKSRQPAQRVGVFVDTQNLFYAAKYTYQARVNFGNILRDVVGDRQLVRAIAYGIKSEDGDEKSFFEALEKRGFDVKVKPLQIFYGGAKKGDWDIGIAMDIMRLAGKLDVVILLSGDGDFVDLLEHAVSLGCRTEVAAFGASCSQRLREAAHNFYELEGNDDYLMQKGKVRVISRNAPAGSGWKGGLPQADAPVSTVDRLEPSVKVERLEPGVEIVRRGPVTSVGTAGTSTTAVKTPTVRRPALPRRPRRKRP